MKQTRSEVSSSEQQKARRLWRAFLLFDIAWALLAIALACEGFFGAALFSRFQVERVTLDFFNDVFLLDLTLETTERAFERFAVLDVDFCQLKTHHLSPL